MPSQVSDRPHVLILGAGLGGMTLAQSLRKQNVTFEIFEKDAALHARSQGWCIALHQVMAQMEEDLPDDLSSIEQVSHLLPLDLVPEFVMYTRDEAQRVRGDKNTRLLRANRSKLREWLYTKLEVNWGKTVTEIREHDSKVTLHFEDGSEATGDVLVGADGVHSIVRSHIFHGAEMLQRIPVGSVIGEVTLNKNDYQKQLALAHSAYIVYHEEKRIFVGMNKISEDAEQADFYWYYNMDTNDAKFHSKLSERAKPEELLNHVREDTASINPKLTEIFHLTKPEGIRPQMFTMWDMVLTSMPNTHITLLGDAAHPMAPARGEGGNHAIQDSLNLGRLLGQANKHDILERLEKYQDEMLKRGSQSVKMSRAAMMDDGHGTVNGWSSWGILTRTKEETGAK